MAALSQMERFTTARPDNPAGDLRRPSSWAASALLPAVFWIGVWQISALAVDRELLLPGPLLVLQTLAALAGTADFWQSAGCSLLRISAGFLGGVLAGTGAALLCCAFRWAGLLLSPLIRMIRATPVASFIVLVLLWAPTGRVPALIAGLMVLPVLWGNVCRGIAQTDPLLLEAALVYRFGHWKTARLVYLPCVLPYFSSGCHTALGLAWKAGVAAEVLCAPRRAIGTQVYYAKIYLKTPELFAWTAVVVALSFLLERLLGSCFDRLGRRWPHD